MQNHKTYLGDRLHKHIQTACIIVFTTRLPFIGSTLYYKYHTTAKVDRYCWIAISKSKEDTEPATYAPKSAFIGSNTRTRERAFLGSKTLVPALQPFI